MKNNPILRAMFWNTIIFLVCVLAVTIRQKNGVETYGEIVLFYIWPIHIIIMLVAGIVDVVRDVFFKVKTSMTRYFISIVWVVILIYLYTMLSEIYIWL